MRTMEERTYVGDTTRARRNGLLPMIIAGVLGLLAGWTLGDIGDSGAQHGLPGGPPTAGESGTTPTDRVGR